MVAIILILAVILPALIFAIDKHEVNKIINNDNYVDPNARFKNDQLLTVHIISHTHDDIGWIRTIDEYYVKQVRYILTTVIQALQENPERKYTYVEQKFFQMWWNEQTESTKEVVRKLIANGQLELNLGGWCMHDEAAPEYESMIYNMAVGAQFIKEQFGIRPKVGWHIDPFGHTTQNARLLADMGFDGYAIDRVDYRLKQQLKDNRDLEFIWKTSDSLGNETSLFTIALYNGYGPPLELDVVFPDYSSNDRWPNIGENPEIESYPDNLETYCDNAANMLRTREQSYNNGGHILITMGEDFTHTDASKEFLQLDGIIKYMNDHMDKYNIKMQYSHLSDYIKAVHNTNKSWKVFPESLMPYSTNDHSAWTGYFTSRPRFKGEVRESLNYLRTVDWFDTKYIIDHNNVDKNNFATKMKLRKAVSQVLHHDAITGTEKQYVADDYLDILARDLYENKQLIENIMVEFTNSQVKYSTDYITAINHISPTNNITMTVINNLGWYREETICLVSPLATINITTTEDEAIQYQITPISEFSLDKRNGSYYIYFTVRVPPLGHYTLTLSHTDHPTITPLSSDKTKIENSLYTITIDPNSGKLLNHIDKRTTITTQLNNQLYHYPSQEKSGAYVFRPEDVASLVTNKAQKIEIFKGPLVEEAHILYIDGYVLILKSYNSGDQKPLFEMNYQLGPLADGHELVSRFVSNLNNNKIAYGDENGLETLKRVGTDTVQPIAGNYYPMTTRAYIEDVDTQRRLTLITDRAHGFAFLNNGELELMLHRRCLNDDGFGVNEALTENDRVIIKIFGLIGSKTDTIDITRRMSLIINHPTHHLYTENKGAKYDGVLTSSMLQSPLPDNIHIATLYVPSTRPIIHLRLHHIYETSDKNDFVQPVSLDLKTMFKDIQVTDVKELCLLGNELLSVVEDERLQWKGDDGSTTVKKPFSLVGSIATLKPMDIGTYEISFSKTH